MINNNQRREYYFVLSTASSIIFSVKTETTTAYFIGQSLSDEMELAVKKHTLTVHQCGFASLRFLDAARPAVSDAVHDAAPSASQERPSSAMQIPSGPSRVHVLPVASGTVALHNKPIRDHEKLVTHKRHIVMALGSAITFPQASPFQKFFSA